MGFGGGFLVCEGLGGLGGGGDFGFWFDERFVDFWGLIGGGVICLGFWLLFDILECDWDNEFVGWFDDGFIVFFCGIGIGVWGFIGWLIDFFFVDDVIVDVFVNVVFENENVLIFLMDVEKWWVFLNGISGGVELFFVGDVVKRFIFCEMDDGDGGGIFMLDLCFGGVFGEKMLLLKEDEVEKYCVLFDI